MSTLEAQADWGCVTRPRKDETRERDFDCGSFCEPIVHDFSRIVGVAMVVGFDVGQRNAEDICK